MKSYKYLFTILPFLILSSCTIYTNDVKDEVDLIYTSIITIKANDFAHIDEFVSVAEYGWDNLDEEIVDYGMVLGYIRFEGTTAWQALPFAVPFEDDFVNLRYLFDINNFSLVVEGEVAGNNAANAALFNNDVLRVIAIPPSEIIKAKAFDYTDFKEVNNFYNLTWNN